MNRFLSILDAAIEIACETFETLLFLGIALLPPALAIVILLSL